MTTETRAVSPQAGPPKPTPAPLPTGPVSLDGARFIGDPAAEGVILVFSDFQCSFCAQFAQEILPVLQRRWLVPGGVRLAFRHFPLVQKHASARRAAEVAECAGNQGQFWPMHDLLFADFKLIDEDRMQSFAKRLGLSGERFSTCLSHEGKEKVAADLAAAKALGVTGTPTFFIGRSVDHRFRVHSRLVGIQPATVFDEAFSTLLKSDAPGSNSTSPRSER